MKRLLITRPRHDPVTHYFYYWSEELISKAQEKGWVLEQAKATRNEVHSRLNSRSHSLVVFNGHGNETSIEGEKGEIILDFESASLLKSTVAFARACNCLNELGGKAIEKECKAFIGYSGRFSFLRVHKYEATPLQDPAAKPVMRTSNVVAIKLLEGSAVSEAVDASHAAAQKEMLRLVSSKEAYDRAALKYVAYNDEMLGFKGNPNARADA